MIDCIFFMIYLFISLGTSIVKLLSPGVLKGKGLLLDLPSWQSIYLLLMVQLKSNEIFMFSLILMLKISHSPFIYCDNIGAYQLCSNRVFHSRMKHFAIKYHIVPEQVPTGALHDAYLSLQESSQPTSFSNFHLLDNSNSFPYNSSYLHVSAILVLRNLVLFPLIVPCIYILINEWCRKSI